jgi:N-acylneuraminate cytidylyltransferase
VLILSRERATIARARAAKLDVPCIDACTDKLTALQAFAGERGITPDRIAYVGNDINDLACMRWVHAPIAVADAAPDVLNVAQWRTARAGGYGAVREVIDVLLAAAPSPGTRI